MKKFMFILFAAVILNGCTFPQTPDRDDLLRGSKQFREKMFNSGARGEVIVSLSDNVSAEGFFDVNYENNLKVKNIQSGEVFYLGTMLGNKKYDTAMLSIGTYEVENLYLVHVYTTCEQIGNTRICTENRVFDEHYEGNKKIRFTIKPAEVTYIGHFTLYKADNEVKEGVPANSSNKNTFTLTDKSGEISTQQRQEWQKEFGTDITVRLATVQ